MNTSKVINTNKAKLTFLENDLVIKKYNKPGKAFREYKYLQCLYNLFPQDKHGGWTYKTVKPLKYCENENKFIMEKIYGETFDKLLKNMPSLSYQTGIWLGLFHNKCRKEKRMLLNIDFNRTNIMFNEDTKTITIIDPGTRFEHECSLEESLISYITGLVSGAIKNKMRPFSLIENFLEGYFTVSKERCNHLNEFGKTIDRVVYNIYTKQIEKKSIHLRPAIRIYGVFIKYYMLTKVLHLIIYYQKKAT